MLVVYTKRSPKKMPGRRTRGRLFMTLSSNLIIIGVIPLANSDLESNVKVMHYELFLETVTS